MSLRWLLATFVATLLTIATQSHIAHAQSAFAEEDTLIEKGATSVALGDVDQDGDLDGWLGYGSGSRIYLRTNGEWVDSGQLLDEEGFILDVALGDFDGDNDPDAVTLDFGDLTIWRNQGGEQSGVIGTYVLSSTLPTDLGTRLALGDLDNDSDLDIMLARGGNRPDTILLNDGNGYFTDSGLLVGTSFGTDIALGDIDGDNDLDAIISTSDTATDDPVPLNEIWLNTTNHFTPVAELFIDSGLRLGVSDGSSVALGDVDGDDDLDVWIAGMISSDILWINEGGNQGGTPGTFSQSVQEIGGFTKEVAFTDFDGDGDLDAVVARSGVGVWLNQGGLQAGTAGTFFFRGQNLGVVVQRFALGNLTDDLYPDLLIAPYNNSSRTSYWVNGDQEAVDIYRGLREEFMRNSPMGLHYISLYEQFTGEIVQLMLSDPTLNANFISALLLWKPSIDALVKGRGDQALVSNEQVKLLDTVLENLELIGSEPLKAAITAERQAIGKPLNDFIGMTVGQASVALVGSTNFRLYMPNVQQTETDGTATWTVCTALSAKYCIVLCALQGCED